MPPAPARLACAMITRFAPSPTGLLHLGHAFSALTAWDRAQAAGGRFLLRIEDIDGPRCRPEFEQAIYDDLHWLGLAWPDPVMRQSDRLPAYAAALDRLGAMGLTYPCSCTRRRYPRRRFGAAGRRAAPGPDGPSTPAPAAHRADARRAGPGRRASGSTWPRRAGRVTGPARASPKPARPTPGTQAIATDEMIAGHRRHRARAQGHRHLLPPRRGGRRRRPRRSPMWCAANDLFARHADPRAAATPARPADARLPPPPADPRRRRQAPRQARRRPRDPTYREPATAADIRAMVGL